MQIGCSCHIASAMRRDMALSSLPGSVSENYLMLLGMIKPPFTRLLRIPAQCSSIRISEHAPSLDRGRPLFSFVIVSRSSQPACPLFPPTSRHPRPSPSQAALTASFRAVRAPMCTLHHAASTHVPLEDRSSPVHDQSSALMVSQRTTGGGALCRWTV